MTISKTLPILRKLLYPQSDGQPDKRHSHRQQKPRLNYIMTIKRSLYSRSEGVWKVDVCITTKIYQKYIWYLVSGTRIVEYTWDGQDFRALAHSRSQPRQPGRLFSESIFPRNFQNFKRHMSSRFSSLFSLVKLYKCQLWARPILMVETQPWKLLLRICEC